MPAKSRKSAGMPSFSPLRNFFRLASTRELLLWCLPALVCGGIARLLLIIHFPYTYLHPDSPDFLVTANAFLIHHRFVLHGKKSFLGPILFTLPMVLKMPSLLVVSWAQHFLGLIYVVMAGAIVRCWTTLWRWWIVPATLLVALNPASLYYEHALIAESQYLWCVTALVLAGSAFALHRTPGRFILLLVLLLLTAGSRPEGKLFVVFCLILIPLVYWGQWRLFAVYGAITLLFSTLTWFTSRNTQAGILLYATLLPLAPDIPRSAPDFGPLIAPLRARRLAQGTLALPDYVIEEKEISPIVFSYLKAKTGSEKTAGDFCQRLAVEAALHSPFLLPPLALDKFLMGTIYPTNEGFLKPWLQDRQIDSATYKTWMVKLMPRLTGRPIHSADDVAAYIRQEFPPLQPDWFNQLQSLWFRATVGARIALPGQPTIPGIPLFYILAAAGMVAALLRPGPMQKVHFAWVVTLLFIAFVVMLTGPVVPRYRFVFEPFAVIYIFVLMDVILGVGARRAPRAEPSPKP